MQNQETKLILIAILKELKSLNKKIINNRYRR